VIGSDPDNRVVILTGSGKAFMESISPRASTSSPRGIRQDLPRRQKGPDEHPGHRGTRHRWRERTGAAALRIYLLADIVLATPSTVFQDKPHFEFGIVPGDGVNLLWPEVIGSVRGRYFLLTRTGAWCRDGKGMGRGQ